MLQLLAILTLVGDITFIASGNELQLALENRNALKGLAVSSDFYVSLQENKKKEITDLAKELYDKRVRPVFVYGYKIDTNLLVDFFGERSENPGFKCKPMFFAGLLITFPLNNALVSATIPICAPDKSEEWFRNWISDYWRETKEDLKNNGYATLP